ncbi:starch binding domain-containing protein [Besnoitia besnoiti]|uniref:Starch binding domain-containing protein n=1 Tax=Besnoitia besnoiti TaxID=94643 RepID=A0A2A9LZ48_BESBE|nr:starch binding domain-containing protein [Besnoitia besnoiti]PFH31039.1 starch binding domain-containing protein [Besnoitia besnoiti]
MLPDGLDSTTQPCLGGMVGLVSGCDVQAQRPPATLEERRRIQEMYREKVKERKIRIYQNALEEVIRREKASSMRHVVFKVPFNTHFGQNLFLIGSDEMLGNWAAEQAVSMVWTQNNIWTCELKFPREATRVEYKYLIKEGSHMIWEPGQNHVIDLRRLEALARPTMSGGAEAAHVIQDSWGRGDAQGVYAGVS